MKMIIVDNSPETRNRLLGLVAQVDGIDVVGMADDAETGMLLAKAHRPDLAIVSLQEEGGIDVIQGIKEAEPESNVVALAAQPSLQNRADALAAGTDYLFNKSKSDELDRLAGLLRLLKNIHTHSDVRH